MKEVLEISDQRVEIFKNYEDRLKKFQTRPLPVIVHYQVGAKRVILAATFDPNQTGSNTPGESSSGDSNDADVENEKN